MSRFCFMIFLFALTHEVLSVIHCRNGWTSYQDSCYLFVDTKESWNDAMLHCRIFGAMLAEVNNADENYFLEREIHSIHANYGFWLGGFDTEIEGQWKWATSDTKMNFTDWIPGEPNDFGDDEDCLEMMSNYHWIDSACRSEMGFICEYRLSEISETVG